MDSVGMTRSQAVATACLLGDIELEARPGKVNRLVNRSDVG